MLRSDGSMASKHIFWLLANRIQSNQYTLKSPRPVFRFLTLPPPTHSSGPNTHTHTPTPTLLPTPDCHHLDQSQAENGSKETASWGEASGGTTGRGGRSCGSAGAGEASLWAAVAGRGGSGRSRHGGLTSRCWCCCAAGVWVSVDTTRVSMLEFRVAWSCKLTTLLRCTKTSPAAAHQTHREQMGSYRSMSLRLVVPCTCSSSRWQSKPLRVGWCCRDMLR